MAFQYSGKRAYAQELDKDLIQKDTPLAPTGYVENWAAAIGMTIDEEMLISEALHTSQSPYVDAARRFTGMESNEFVKRNKRLDDHLLDGTLTQEDVAAASVHGPLDYDALATIAQSKGVDEMTDEQVMENLRDTLAQRREYAEGIYARADASGIAGQFLGAMQASSLDPQNVAAMAVAPAIRGAQLMTFAERARQRAIAAGGAAAFVSIPTQGQIWKWKQDIHSPWTAGDAAINVVADVVGNVALDQVAHGLGHWLRSYDTFNDNQPLGRPYRLFKDWFRSKDHGWEPVYPWQGVHGLPSPDDMHHIPISLPKPPDAPTPPAYHETMTEKEFNQLVYLQTELQNAQNFLVQSGRLDEEMQEKSNITVLNHGNMTSPDEASAWWYTVQDEVLTAADIDSGRIFEFLGGFTEHSWPLAIAGIRNSPNGMKVRNIYEQWGPNRAANQIVPQEGVAYFHSGSGSDTGIFHSGHPVFFSSSKEASASYQNAKIGQPFYHQGFVGQYKLNISKTYDTSANTEHLNRLMDKAHELYPDITTRTQYGIKIHENNNVLPGSKGVNGSNMKPDVVYLPKVVEWLKKQGYDSLHMTDTSAPSMIVLDPTNIQFVANSRLTDPHEVTQQSKRNLTNNAYTVGGFSHARKFSTTHEPEAGGTWSAKVNITGLHEDNYSSNITAWHARSTSIRESLLDLSVENPYAIRGMVEAYDSEIAGVINSNMARVGFAINRYFWDGTNLRSNYEIRNLASNMSISLADLVEAEGLVPVAVLAPTGRYTDRAEFKRQGFSNGLMAALADMVYEADNVIDTFNDNHMFMFASDGHLTDQGKHWWQAREAEGHALRSPHKPTGVSGSVINDEGMPNFVIRPDRIEAVSQVNRLEQGKGKYVRPNYHPGVLGDIAKRTAKDMNKLLERQNQVIMDLHRQIEDAVARFSEFPKPNVSTPVIQHWDVMDSAMAGTLTEVGPPQSIIQAQNFTIEMQQFVNQGLAANVYTPGGTISDLEGLVLDILTVDQNKQVPLVDANGQPAGMGSLYDWHESAKNNYEDLISLWQCYTNG